ncbi:MAG TPA: glycosyltransferase family 1 protein [Nitrospiraceae bacterium]|nr:glycosyltransferase family 1 protein [Nitrospiraceae bacterium]
MKIAYDSQIFCAQTYGGVSRYFCEIASRIAKEPGVQVCITAPMHINAYLAHVPPGIVSGFRAPKTDCFQTNCGANYPRLALRGLGLLMGDWMLHAMKPDIVHETYFSPYRLGARRARRVLTIYDMIHEKFAPSFPHADKTARYKALAAERADHVICISESTRRDAIEILELPFDKTSVIYLGFDLMNTAGARVEELVLPTRGPFLLYVGKRGGYKNFLRLLEAYGASPQLKAGYKLICFGSGAFHADELKTMQTVGLDSGQVMQLGGDDKLLAKLYERASAFIFPSLYEGFGIPPLEAMSYDCPVVCSNTSSIPEVVGDAGEYFDPADTESMRAAIERVVTSDSHRKLLIAKGRARLKYFSWDCCAIETLDIYRKLT